MKTYIPEIQIAQKNETSNYSSFYEKKNSGIKLKKNYEEKKINNLFGENFEFGKKFVFNLKEKFKFLNDKDKKKKLKMNFEISDKKQEKKILKKDIFMKTGNKKIIVNNFEEFLINSNFSKKTEKKNFLNTENILKNNKIYFDENSNKLFLKNLENPKIDKNKENRCFNYSKIKTSNLENNKSKLFFDF